MAEQEQARVAVVTGASSGIGKAAAKALAAQGWRVIGLGRDPERCAAAEAEIRAQAAPGAQVEMIRVDLSLMADTARVANEIISRTDRVDVLLNNAGGVARTRVITSEGNEATFAGNHLGHFLLTKRLLPLLRAAAADSAPGSTRIVSVSSDANEYCTGLDWDDLQMIGNFVAGAAYCRVKLANILFTRALAKRLAGDGIVAHAMHPGVVSSNFINYADEGMQSHIRTLKDVSVSPEEGADTLIWLATAVEPGATSGSYFYKRAVATANPVAGDDAAAERLWIESEKLLARALL
jgi:NAD(P)-dependent dehydrogenase (short-subunit alcohol dehydrogenase family)